MGLDSFKSTNSGSSGNTHTTDRGDSDGDGDEDEPENAIFGVAPEKWVAMSEEERIAEVRKREVADFNPEATVDKSWSYQKLVAVSCVCGESFLFETAAECPNCGREYRDTGRTVVKEANKQEQ